MNSKTTYRSEQIEQDLYRQKEPIADETIGCEPPIDTDGEVNTVDDASPERQEIC